MASNNSLAATIAALETARAARIARDPEYAANLAAREKVDRSAFAKAKAKRRDLAAQHLMQAALELDVRPEDHRILASVADKYRSAMGREKGWTFVMLNPLQNKAVVRWLGQNSKWPKTAPLLWAELFTALRSDTGEILRTRAELADAIDQKPNTVSSMMSELVQINAIRREKVGREVKYFMNPYVATHLPDPVNRAVARDEAGPLFMVMQGGKAGQTG